MSKYITGDGGHVTITAVPNTPDQTTPAGVTFPLNQPVTEWSCKVENDVQEVTDTGAGGWVVKIPGYKSWSGSATFYWDATTSALTAAALFAPGLVLTVSLMMGKYKANTAGTSAATPGYTAAGTCIVKGFSIKSSAKGAVECSIDFDGTGPLTVS